MKKKLLHFLVVCLFTSKIAYGMDLFDSEQVNYWKLQNTYLKIFQEVAKRYLENFNFEKKRIDPYIFYLGIDSEDIFSHIHRLYPEAFFFGSEVSSVKEERHDHWFDYAVSFLSLQPFNDKDKLVEYFFKSLKPGGEIFLTAETCDEGISFHKNCITKLILAKKEWGTFLQNLNDSTMTEFENNYISEDEMEKLLKDAGFIDIKVERKVESYEFKSVEELAIFLRVFLFGYLGHQKIKVLFEKETKELAMKCAKEWIAASESDQISYSWTNLVVTAKKPLGIV